MKRLSKLKQLASMVVRIRELKARIQESSLRITCAEQLELRELVRQLARMKKDTKKQKQEVQCEDLSKLWKSRKWE